MNVRIVPRAIVLTGEALASVPISLFGANAALIVARVLRVSGTGTFFRVRFHVDTTPDGVNWAPTPPSPVMEFSLVPFAALATIGVFEGNDPAFSFVVTGRYARVRVEVVSTSGVNEAVVEVDVSPRKV